MSILESEAKTPEEIMRSAKMPHGFKAKWILLEEAQKEISFIIKDRNSHINRLSTCCENQRLSIVYLEAKIGEVNRILEEELALWRKAYGAECGDLQASAIQALERVKASLNRQEMNKK